MTWIKARYPNVLAFHVPNGGNRSGREGARFKREGVMAGVPDVLICSTNGIDYGSSNGIFFGLAIELKVKGGTVSHLQRDVLKRFESANWSTSICWNLDEFIEIVENYMQ